METVADILHAKGREVWMVAVGSSVGDALELMAEKNIGAVLVADKSSSPIGIVSERDIARALLRKGSHLMDLPVTEIMTRRVKCVRESLTIDDAMAVMTHNRFRHLPVCDGDRVVGLISIGDIVKAEIDEKQFVIEQLENYISGSV